MNIKFLKAGSGDSILIKEGNKNILIDGGNDNLFLIDEYKKIVEKKQRIDFLIVTHHDDDHIKGVLQLFDYIKKKDSLPHIGTFIFNSPRKINNTLKIEEKNNFISYKQAYELENILLEYNNRINWITSDEFQDNEIGKLKFQIFSPERETLLKYSSGKGAYLSNDFRCDWEVSMKDLNKKLDDKSQDRSLSNETSVVVYMQYQENKFLFTGDITPKRFSKIIDEIKGKDSKLSLDLMKLPHHGSYRSLNSEILQKIICSNYVISTNSRKHFLPNKRAFLKIINNRHTEDQISFMFNYGEVINKLNISKNELKGFNISLKPNNKEWGYGIDL